MFFKHKPSISPQWQFAALGTFIVMLIVNGLAGSTTILGGVNTATVSDTYPNLFAPAGVTFSIWGVIYTLLLGHVLWLFGVWRKGADKKVVKATHDILPWFVASSVINVLWLLAWQYQVLWLSVLLMIGLLVSLIKINNRLRQEAYSTREFALVRLPFSVYFGWITVATIANITTWLVSIKWDGLGYSDGTWMVAVLIVGAVIGVVTALRNYDWAYMAVFVWAYSGILLKHLNEQGFDGAYPSTITTLTILLPVFIVVAVLLGLRAIPGLKRP